MKFVLSVLADPSVWSIASLFASEKVEHAGQTLIVGVIVGGAQWLFFRSRHVQKSAAWIGVMVLSMLLVQVVPSPTFSPFIQLSDGSSPELYVLFQTVFIIVSGIVLGLSTGLLLLDFISQEEQI